MCLPTTSLRWELSLYPVVRISELKHIKCLEVSVGNYSVSVSYYFYYCLCSCSVIGRVLLYETHWALVSYILSDILSLIPRSYIYSVTSHKPGLLSVQDLTCLRGKQHLPGRIGVIDKVKLPIQMYLSGWKTVGGQ